MESPKKPRRGSWRLQSASSATRAIEVVMNSHDTRASRRQLLKWLAASPLLACPGLAGLAAQSLAPVPQKNADPIMWAPPNLQNLITSPGDAINVFDFEPVMRKVVPPAHFGYMASGIDDEVTLRANREGFLKFQLLPRRLVDVSQLDLTMELFGRSYGSPVVLVPSGIIKDLHEDCDLAVSMAAYRTNHTQ